MLPLVGPSLQKNLFLHNHGVVITGPDGKIAYLQVTGYPDQLAIQKTIGELFVKHFQPPRIPAEKPRKAGSGG